MMNLNYTPTEKITVERPVERIKYITNICNNKNVLDLGCFDETARVKEQSGNYLFDEISQVCALHIGVDNSTLLPDEGMFINESIKILKADIYHLDNLNLSAYNFDVIIAGELIEHLPDTLTFFLKLKEQFRGKRLICTTPNATSFSNMLLSLIKRESSHIDHLQIYSYKTLNTLCRVAGFTNWTIIPYHVKYTEMIMRSAPGKRQAIRLCERIINGIETLFPMTAGGYIVDIKL